MAAPAVLNEAWTQLAPTGPQPLPRRDVGAAYDSQRDRLVALSGNGTTWILDLSNPAATWVQLQGVTYSSSPGFERAIHDPVGDRMVMVNSNMQVFLLSLANPTAWVPLSVTGSPPPARTAFAATYDSFRNRLVTYGGGPFTGLYNDIWALNLSGTSQWTPILPIGGAPPPTWGPIVVYDPDRDQLILGTGSRPGTADGTGRLTYEDTTVDDDERYGYRLGILEPGEGETILPETWVNPLSVAFSLTGRVVNPSQGGRIALTFSMPFSAAAMVRLFDVAGREIERQELGAGAGGVHTVEFGAQQHLRAGVYLVRAMSAGVVITRRVAVLD